MLQKVCKWQVRLLFTRVSRNWLYVLNTLIVIILGFGGVGAVFGGPQRLDLMKLGVFDDDGGVIASPGLTEAGRSALAISSAPALKLTDAHLERLVWHRENCWKG